MDVFLAKLSLIIGHIATAMLPLIMNNLSQKYTHSGLTLVIKHPLKVYNDIPNDFDHIEELYAIHEGFSWAENLTRLVEATSNIKPQKGKFMPDDSQLHNLFSSIGRAEEFIASEDYETLKADLAERVQRNLRSIIVASHIENVNIRGRLIEYLITTENSDILDDVRYLESRLPVYDTKNGLGDYVRVFPKRKTYTDIKTKIMYLGSNPKAYNVDKFLECMSEDNSVFMFYFVGIDETGLANSVLCPVYDRRLIDATILQFHWAGRATRGGSQFNGNAVADILLTKDFRPSIDAQQCEAFLQTLLGR